MEENQPQPVQTHRKKLTKRTKVALWLIIGPTVLACLVFIIFALTNLVFNPTLWPTPDGENFADTPIGITILNIILFTAISVSVLTWLPGLIIGFILLVKKPKQPNTPVQ